MAEPFTDAAAALNFITAGNARVTLRSARTGTRYTYRVRSEADHVPNRAPGYYVELLKGRDNRADYTYIGMLRGGVFFTTKSTHHLREAAFVKAMGYVLKHLSRGHLPPQAEVWHESRCGVCGRPLTVPSSISTGIGPECSKRRN